MLPDTLHARLVPPPPLLHSTCRCTLPLLPRPCPNPGASSGTVFMPISEQDLKIKIFFTPSMLRTKCTPRCPSNLVPPPFHVCYVSRSRGTTKNRVSFDCVDHTPWSNPMYRYTVFCNRLPRNPMSTAQHGAYCAKTLLHTTECTTIGESRVVRTRDRTPNDTDTTQ